MQQWMHSRTRHLAIFIFVWIVFEDIVHALATREFVIIFSFFEHHFFHEFAIKLARLNLVRPVHCLRERGEQRREGTEAGLLLGALDSFVVGRDWMILIR